MITIDQLLESVDLDFEPRWVTKDESGDITIFLHKPIPEGWCAEWRGRETKYECLGRVKLAEFADKPWQECIYEVPRKTTGKIEKLKNRISKTRIAGEDYEISHQPTTDEIVIKINELVDMVNNIISVQEKMIDSRFVVDAVNELKGE
jgi:hypothetical protein